MSDRPSPGDPPDASSREGARGGGDPSPPVRPMQGDLTHEAFARGAARVLDLVSRYLRDLEAYSVLPPVKPGDVRRRVPDAPPEQGEPLEAILEDYRRWIEPNVTHWQHPGFLAYFSSTASAPGILGEWLAAALNSNVMFWKNAPASTELEERVIGWMAEALGLPREFDGMFTDTASVSTLLSVVAARHALEDLDIRDRGLAGRTELPVLRLYCSQEAHASVDKAAIVAGIGRENVVRVAVDEAYRMRPAALRDAVERDRRAGYRPFCVVGTLGTTSSTSVDPAGPLAEVCRREGLWLHLDAAYGGAAALAPEFRPMFEGWEQADSIVVNPHKWMWTPFDASVLLFRRPQVYRSAFSLVPDYLHATGVEGAHNYSEYGIQMGRRFRALKLWMIFRTFGTEGMAERIRGHVALAREFASWVEAHPDWSLAAPVPFSTVCFRHVPRADAEREDDPEMRRRLDAMNLDILEQVNRSGEVYLSGTRLAGRYVLRVSVGNLRTQRRHLERCWTLLQQAAEVAR